MTFWVAEEKPNQPPVAVIDPSDDPIIIEEGKALILDGSGSQFVVSESWNDEMLVIFE